MSHWKSAMLGVVLLAAGGVCAAADSTALPAGIYRLDPSHSTLTFSVSHLGFSRYVGGFDAFDATLEFDPEDVASTRLDATVRLGSLRIPAPPEGFVATLLGADWLNAIEFPDMKFESQQVTPTGPGLAEVQGTLTLNGHTQRVTLRVQFNGGYAGHPFDPAARAGFSAQGTLQRSAFGLSLGVPEPGSTFGVGDEVTIEIEAEFSGPPSAAEG